jgi:hypothetical protein
MGGSSGHSLASPASMKELTTCASVGPYWLSSVQASSREKN